MRRPVSLGYILWLLFLLAVLVLGAWLVWEGLSVPPALRHTVWQSGAYTGWLVS